MLALILPIEWFMKCIWLVRKAFVTEFLTQLERYPFDRTIQYEAKVSHRLRLLHSPCSVEIYICTFSRLQWVAQLLKLANAYPTHAPKGRLSAYTFDTDKLQVFMLNIRLYSDQPPFFIRVSLFVLFSWRKGIFQMLMMKDYWSIKHALFELTFVIIIPHFKFSEVTVDSQWLKMIYTSSAICVTKSKRLEPRNRLK